MVTAELKVVERYRYLHYCRLLALGDFRAFSGKLTITFAAYLLSMKTVSRKQRLLKRSSGQGITEYAAILAFVALLVALVFAFAPNTLSGAISAAFSAVCSHLNNMSAASGSAS
jgi:Flp pilus assembly pilin Flp